MFCWIVVGEDVCRMVYVEDGKGSWCICMERTVGA